MVFVDLTTWFTLGVELSLAFMLWTKRTGWLRIAPGLVMHLGFDYVMGLGFFLSALLVECVVFLRPAELERALRWVGSLRGGQMSGPSEAENRTREMLVNS